MILPPLDRQRIVLTGASSGIGLATARMAAAAGARLILVARNEAALEQLAEELGGPEVARPCPGDVAEPATHARAARMAQAAFGGFDSWVNDAGAFIYGRVDEVSEADHRRLFDVIYWGVLHGSLEALRGLPDAGGSLVNIGSVLSLRTIALQGPYCAAKHAVKALTDALRMEARMAGRKANIALVKPAAIDTPYMEHARTYLEAAGARNPPPAYHPRLVAQAILHACTHPVRDMTVGGAGAMIAWMGQLAPGLTDRVMELTARPLQESDQPGRAVRRDNLWHPREDLAETSSLAGPPPRRTSWLLQAQMHPLAAAAAGAGGMAALALLARPRRRRRQG